MNFVYPCYHNYVRREFLKQNLISTILFFFLHDISPIFMPRMNPYPTLPYATLLARPTRLLSIYLSRSFTMPGMNIPCEPQSPSLSENEACDIIVRQN